MHHINFKKHFFYIFIGLLFFKIGYESKAANLFPVGQFIARVLNKEPSGYNNPDVYKDLYKRVEVDCPKSSDSYVLVALGQSNSGNFINKKYTDDSKNIYNFFNDKCYVAEDPILGASGDAGSLWIPFAQKLASITKKKIVLINFSQGGSSVISWNNSEHLGYFLEKGLISIGKNYRHVDSFFWIQGEADHGLNPEQYTQSLTSIIRQTKNKFPDSKFYISDTTYCFNKSDQAIYTAQHTLAKNLPDVFWLGSTDQFQSLQYRWDNCHFNELGVEKVSSMFIENIQL
jgi:hypothetical protein